MKLLRDATLVVEFKPKFWVKKKGFKLLLYPLLGLVDVLCLPLKTKVCNKFEFYYSSSSTIRYVMTAKSYYKSFQKVNDGTLQAGWRCVAFVADFFDILKQIHQTEKGHIGGTKPWKR